MLASDPDAARPTTCPEARPRGLDRVALCGIVDPLITGFRCQATERIWLGLRSHRLPEDIQGVARRKLRYLNAAGRLEDLRVPPGNRLEVLKGDRDGQHSIRINRQWRICFRWSAGNAFDVEIVDYH